MQKRQRILLVVNPISANRDKEDIVESILRAAKLLQKETVIYKTEGENDKEKIAQLLKEETFSRILVVGGDGSIKLVAENLDNPEIPIGIIPAGSANGLAYNLGIPTNPKEAVNVAMEDYFTTVDGIEIEKELCLHMSDFGLNAALIKNYEASNFRGKLGYLIQSLPTLFSSDYPYRFKVEAEGKTYEQEGVLLAIANAKKYGTGANVNPNGRLNDGKFEILIFKNLNPADILKTLRNEGNIDPDFLQIISVQEAVLTCEKPVPFQIDGEYRGERQQANVQISSKKFKIAVPSAYKEI